MKKTILRTAATALLALAATNVSMANGDPVKGEKSFRKCKACHSFDPAKRMMGPSLKGVYGRQAGTLEGYKYSKAFEASDVVWDDETLGAYLTAPRKFIKGTKMAFAGIRKPEELQDLLAYLKQEAE